MADLFFPEQKSINDLFPREISYTIPDYQRPYSWDCLGKNEKNNQINIMWDDLFSAFENKRNGIYFFGSMVLINDGKGRQFIVIDGQQRLTSVALLFVAIKCFLKDRIEKIEDLEFKDTIAKIISVIDDMLYNEKLFGGISKEKKVKIERNAGFDYDTILKETFECYDTTKQDIKNATDEQKAVVARYFNNKKYFVEKLQECFTSSKNQFDYKQAERLNDFFDFLKNNVNVVTIRTQSFDIAYHIFEILNNRGLQLSNKDLLRNYIMKKFDELKNSSTKYKEINPAEKWNELDEDLDSEFIGRWVESHNATQQKSSAYKDIIDIYDKDYKDKLNKKRIEIFHSDLKTGLKYYNKIINYDIENPRLKQKLKVILNAGNVRYSMNFLMSLFNYSKGKETKEVLELVNLYERRLWYYILYTRFSSSDIYKTISNFNTGNYTEAKKNLLNYPIIRTINRDVVTTMDTVRALIRSSIMSNDIAKLLIAKYVWIQEAETKDDVVEQTLDFSKCTLEHIYPQNPKKGTNWLTGDFVPKDKFIGWTYLLGNMTLLTQRMNSAAKNYDFKEKQKQYAKTKLGITRELVDINEIDQNYIRNRHKKITDAILKDLELV